MPPPPIPAPAGDAYTLHPLLYPALPPSSRAGAGLNPTSPAAVSLSVRCAAGHGRNLYVGSSDGCVHHYVLGDEGSSREPDQFHLVSSKPLSSSPSHPIERILILHRIGLAAIVADGTLSFLHLPNLDALPPNTLPTLRGVVTVVLDDEEVDAGGVDGEGYVSLCVLKRRGAVLAKVGMGQWIPIKDVPTPRGTVLAGRRGDTLCTATTTEYSLVNLSTSTIVPLGLPISHSSSSPSASTRPSIVSIPGRSTADECEFLITSHSDQQTLGVFVRASGEPAAKLIEWDSHPRALALVHPHLVALLRDDTIQVYTLQDGGGEDAGAGTVDKVQTIHLPAPLEPRLLAAGTSALQVVTASAKASDLVVAVDPATRRNDDEGDGTALPDFPAATQHPAWRTAILHGRDQHARLLMTCRNAVQSLVEPVQPAHVLPLITQGRWAQLEQALEELWASQASADSASPTLSTLRHIYALVALRQLYTLDFYAATTSFIRSSLDVRFLMRLFPGLADQSPDSHAPTPHLFVALEQLAAAWQPLDGMIRANLAMNYAPHLLLETDPHLQALRDALTNRAWDMLQAVLLHVRSEAPAPDARVDTALARLYAQRGDTRRLAALLADTSNACDAAAVEGPAREAGALAPLARLFAQRGEWEKAFEIWTQMVDAGSEAGGDDGLPSVEELVRMLQECGLPHAQRRYAFWVVKHDATAGVELLTRQGPDATAADSATAAPAPAAAADPSEIVAQLRAAGAHAAAEAYIEQLVLAPVPKRSGSTSAGASNLDQELVDLLLARLEGALRPSPSSSGEDGGAAPDARHLFTDLAQSYLQGGYAEPFISHLAVHASGAGPHAPAIRDRLKLAMLLQGSNAYDVQAALGRIEGMERAGAGAPDSGSDSSAPGSGSPPLACAFAYERALLLGKLAQDEPALRLLALGLRDASSAEAYCTQAGVVLSPFVAEQLAATAGATATATETEKGTATEKGTLAAYAALVGRGVRAWARARAKERGVKAPRGRKGQDAPVFVDEGEKSRLLKTLLKVYMEAESEGGNGSSAASADASGDASARLRTATAHLLNTQFSSSSSLSPSPHTDGGEPAPSPISDLLPLVPPHWPLSTLSTFLVRSLRRESHARHARAIERGVCLSRSLEVGEEGWRVSRALGGVIQEEGEGGVDGDGQGEGGVEGEEKRQGGEKEGPPRLEKDLPFVLPPEPPRDTHAELDGSRDETEGGEKPTSHCRNDGDGLDGHVGPL